MQPSTIAICRWPVALLLCLALRLGVAAPAPQAEEDEQPTDSAPVVVDGNVLFRVAGIPSFPASRRASEVRERIIAVARDSQVAPASMSVAAREDRFDILAGERRLVSIVPRDAALEGIGPHVAADLFAARTKEAIERYRADRQPEALLRAAGFALGATVLAAALLWLFIRVFRRLLGWVERRFHARVQAVKIDTFEVLRAERIWTAITGLLRLARLLVVAALLYVYLQYTLQLFPWTRGVGRGLLDLVSEPLQSMGAAVVDYIPKLVFLILLFFITRYLVRAIGVFFRAVELGNVRLQGFDVEWAQPTMKLIRVLIILLALVIAYPYIPGSSSAAFQGISIFVGVLLSLGASSAVSSIIAGYSMTFRRAFRTGDRISIGQYTGEVTERRLLVTHLRTIKNEEIVVPNSLILSDHVVNYSRLAETEGLILHTTVGIGYEVPWRQVEAMLLLAARRTSGVLHQPPPFVLELSLANFAITYELNVYVNTARQMAERYAELHRNILDVCNEHGVQIMTPAYEGDPERPKIVAKENWHAPPARQPGAGAEA
jgi:small-conductance mechanosensitive channel